MIPAWAAVVLFFLGLGLGFTIHSLMSMSE